MPSPTEPTLRGHLRLAIERAWAAAIASGALAPIGPRDESPAIRVERPANPDHGDAATNLAMKLARPYRRSPLEIARLLADELAREADATPGTTPVGSVDVAAPGFINVRYADRALAESVGGILASPGDWGRVPAARPRHVDVEFVSANPTGPLTIGNARGAFVGDLLCRVLEAGGQRVVREYYFNDSGSQVLKLGASVVATRRSETIPGDGSHGDYVADLAAAVPNEVWAAAEAAPAEAAAIVGRWASERVRAGIEASLEHLGVHFDVWKTERSLHDEGWVERAIERLRVGGHVYEQDGALWFRSTTFGDDKDRVITRSNGEPTYFASDIGYVTEKFSRGFDELIYIWGQDHHGTVARVRNAAEAMGYDKAAVRMLLVAWVRFVRDGQDVAMSKRAGTFISLDELLQEIGVDAARWFFASRGPSSAIDFDIELAKKQSNENPVYYVQYA
ncbi:MAG: arginine--tRNA ligase, partial [Candidatus Limnocylindrales bacterium]